VKSVLKPIIKVFQDFVLKCDDTFIALPPFCTRVSRGFTRKYFDAYVSSDKRTTNHPTGAPRRAFPIPTSSSAPVVRSGYLGFSCGKAQIASSIFRTFIGQLFAKSTSCAPYAPFSSGIGASDADDPLNW
jgi:hypothetical protein